MDTRAFPRPGGSLPPTSTSTTCGAGTRDSKTGPRMRSIGLHYRRYEQLHDERSITYEPHEAVQGNPATSVCRTRRLRGVGSGSFPRSVVGGIAGPERTADT